MMKSGKGHLEVEEEEEDDDYGAKKDATPSANNTKDGKSNDKASAMRSKHSVTEQRRRSKINERFQILRELIPNSDQKRDTASFLLEVIQYVQFLQAKVQKYEVSYQPWSSEPTKLMPWRNSQWRVQNVVGEPQTMKSGSGPSASFSGRFDDSSLVPTTMQHGQQNPIESDHVRDVTSRTIDLQTELPNKAMGVSVPLQTTMSVPMENEGAYSHALHGQSSNPKLTECPSGSDTLNHHNELTIEGGTISISSVYSEELLNSLAQALQSTGVDLSQANISVQINLGKRANRESTPGISVVTDHGTPMPSANPTVGNFQDTSNNNTDLHHQAQKRQKI